MGGRGARRGTAGLLEVGAAVPKMSLPRDRRADARFKQTDSPSSVVVTGGGGWNGCFGDVKDVVLHFVSRAAVPHPTPHPPHPPPLTPTHPLPVPPAPAASTAPPRPTCPAWGWEACGHGGGSRVPRTRRTRGATFAGASTRVAGGRPCRSRAQAARVSPVLLPAPHGEGGEAPRVRPSGCMTVVGPQCPAGRTPNPPRGRGRGGPPGEERWRAGPLGRSVRGLSRGAARRGGTPAPAVATRLATLPDDRGGGRHPRQAPCAALHRCVRDCATAGTGLPRSCCPSACDSSRPHPKTRRRGGPSTRAAPPHAPPPRGSGYHGGLRWR
jgi:hypothetical protein